MNLTQTHSPETSQGTFESSKALKLFYRSWYPQSAKNCSQSSARPCANERPDKQSKGSSPKDSSPKAPIKGVLAIVHGLGEHSGRYYTIVKALTDEGYAVFAFDNQGHGKSEGQRGHIDRWQDYRDNTRAFLQLVRQQEPTAPLFVMGHSLGGLIVLDYVLRSAQTPVFQALNILGIIISAPPIQPAKGTASSVRILLARVLSGLFPRLTLNMGLDKSGLSRKQEIAEEVADDPLIHSCVTLRWGSETLYTIEWVKAHIDQLRLPILLTHGDADPIIAPEGSCEIFQQIQIPDKTLTLYPGSYHEPHNDLDADLVTTDLVNWLNGYVTAAV